MKNSHSNINQRQHAILDQLQHIKSITINQLADELAVSVVTIRRDVAFLESQGLLVRFHGGVKRISSSLDISPRLTNHRGITNDAQLNEKKAIACKAASLVNDGDIIFLNSSSTCLLMLEYLNNKSVTIITNNAKVVLAPHAPSLEIILTGGELNDRNRSLVGDFAIQSLMRIVADKAFIGINGISADRGLTSCVLQQTVINKLMMERCGGQCFVLADHTKIGKQNNFSSGKIEFVSTLITSAIAPTQPLNAIATTGVSIITVNTNPENE